MKENTNLSRLAFLVGAALLLYALPARRAAALDASQPTPTFSPTGTPASQAAGWSSCMDVPDEPLPQLTLDGETPRRRTTIASRHPPSR